MSGRHSPRIAALLVAIALALIALSMPTPPALADDQVTPTGPTETVEPPPAPDPSPTPSTPDAPSELEEIPAPEPEQTEPPTPTGATAAEEPAPDQAEPTVEPELDDPPVDEPTPEPKPDKGTRSEHAPSAAPPVEAWEVNAIVGQIVTVDLAHFPEAAEVTVTSLDQGYAEDRNGYWSVTPGETAWGRWPGVTKVWAVVAGTHRFDARRCNDVGRDCSTSQIVLHVTDEPASPPPLLPSEVWGTPSDSAVVTVWNDLIDGTDSPTVEVLSVSGGLITSPRVGEVMIVDKFEDLGEELRVSSTWKAEGEIVVRRCHVGVCTVQTIEVHIVQWISMRDRANDFGNWDVLDQTTFVQRPGDPLPTVEVTWTAPGVEVFIDRGRFVRVEVDDWSALGKCTDTVFEGAAIRVTDWTGETGSILDIDCKRYVGCSNGSWGEAFDDTPEVELAEYCPWAHPAARDDRDTTAPGQAVEIPILTNDEFVDSSPTVELLDLPDVEAEFTLNADGTVTVLPDDSLAGETLTFRYRLDDDEGDENELTKGWDIARVTVVISDSDEPRTCRTNPEMRRCQDDDPTCAELGTCPDPDNPIIRAGADQPVEAGSSSARSGWLLGGSGLAIVLAIGFGLLRRHT